MKPPSTRISASEKFKSRTNKFHGVFFFFFWCESNDLDFLANQLYMYIIFFALLN